MAPRRKAGRRVQRRPADGGLRVRSAGVTMLTTAVLLLALALAGCSRGAAPAPQKGAATQPATQPVTQPVTEPTQPTSGTAPTPTTPATQPPKPTTSAAPITYSAASSPDPAGPWTPLAQNRWLPEGHQWLRLSFSGPVVPDPRAQWTDDQTAILRIDPAARVVPVGGWKAADAARVVWDWPLGAYAYRGPAPQLVRTAPGGPAIPLHTLDGVPERLDYAQGGNQVRVQAPPVSYRVEVQTGVVTNDGSMMSGGHDYGEVIFWSPDQAWRAEVVGYEYWGTGALLERGTLVISAGNQEAYRLEQWLPYHRCSSAPGCAFGRPNGAWRPDGAYLAITAVPEPNVAELRVLDRVTREYAVAVRLEGQQRGPQVTWSPDGRYLTFGSTLLSMRADGTVDHTISTALGQKLFWRADSRYLLTSQAHTYQWGHLLLIEAATGKAQDLGYGWPLGFTAGGEALYASWESSSEYP